MFRMMRIGINRRFSIDVEINTSSLGIKLIGNFLGFLLNEKMIFFQTEMFDVFQNEIQLWTN